MLSIGDLVIIKESSFNKYLKENNSNIKNLPRKIMAISQNGKMIMLSFPYYNWSPDDLILIKG